MVKALAAPFPGGAVHPDRRHHRRQPRRLPGPAGGARGRRHLDGRRRRCIAAGDWAEITRLHRRGGRAPRDRESDDDAADDPRAADDCRYDAGRARRGHAAPRPGRGPGPHRARSSGPGRAAASTTWPAACAAASACAPRVVTAFADNEVGRLLEDLILQGGVDTSLIRWVPYDGIGRTVRNGLNFTERGFGVRGAVGVSDRGHTAASQLRARRRRLGPHLRHARRALVAHRRHLRRAVRHHAGRGRGGDGRGQAGTAPSSRTT